MIDSDRWYHRPEGESPAEREVVELVGRVVLAWGALDTVLSKLWWHLAFQAGSELDPEPIYQKPIGTKLQSIRRLIQRDGGRRDAQLQIVEKWVPTFEQDRHAIAHGYLSMSAKGPVAVNLRNGRTVFAIDLPGLRAWSAYLADVAHQMYEEETCGYYGHDEEYFRPDPVEPPPLLRTALG